MFFCGDYWFLLWMIGLSILSWLSMDVIGFERLDISLFVGGNVLDSIIRSFWYWYENYLFYLLLRIFWEFWLFIEESGFWIFVVLRNFFDIFRGMEGSEFKCLYV